MLVPGSGFPLDDDDQGVIQQRKVEFPLENILNVTYRRNKSCKSFYRKPED